MLYLNDVDFLRKICSQPYQKIYIKINLLNLDEIPIESLEGIATGGNISIDGSSALSRSCSLKISVSSNKYVDSYWALNSKINLLIGVENFTDKYLDFPIIYFPMGIYYLTSFSADKNNSDYTVSVSGKDKMCKLTGELGGIFNSSIDFGSLNIINPLDGTTIKEPISIKNIIYEMIHYYGHEPYEKILINDLEDYALNLITYKGLEDIYYFMNIKNNNTNNQDIFFPNIINYYIQNNNIKFKFKKIDPNNSEEQNIFKLGETECIEKLKDCLSSYYSFKTILDNCNLEEIKKLKFFKYNFIFDRFDQTEIENLNLCENFEEAINLIQTAIEENNIFIMGKYSYGDSIGYELTSLVFPGDLIANAGETITSVLDKIKKILGEFIYFYDLNGNFVFKKKNQYLQEESPLNISFSLKNPEFILSDNLISSISYSYNLSDIKNDYTVWGEQKLSNGIVNDIHARIVIDEKPTNYTKIKIDKDRAEMLITKYSNYYYPDKTIDKNDVIRSLLQDSTEYTIYDNIADAIKVDWREIIYQMALDYTKFHQIDEYAEWLKENNYNYSNGETGYERYYTDLLGFWRNLYSSEKKTRMAQLQDLKEDNDIEYEIQTVGRGDTESFLCTTNGIDYAYNGDNSKEENEKLKQEIGLDSSNFTVFEIQNTKAEVQNNRVFPRNNKSYYQKLKWDIEPYDFPDIQLYRKIINQSTLEEEFIAVGTTKEIIATNYKILGYMYYIVSPWIFWKHENIYLISEDIDSHYISTSSGPALWRIVQYNTKKYEERFNFYNNKIWTYVENNKAFLLGAYYDITTLYYNIQDVININDMDNNLINLDSGINSIDSSTYEYITSDTDLTLTNISKDKNNFLSIDFYPKNKEGVSLTNITNMEHDKNALMLYARANRILFEIDNSFGEDGFKKDVKEQPDKLKFWFDFLPPDKFNQIYSIANIGPREIVKKDTAVNCITSLPVPDAILINPTTNIGNSVNEQLKIHQSSYKKARPYSSFMNIDINFAKKIIISSTTKSAIDVIINLLYNHAIATNSLNVSCIPQYYFNTDSLLWILDTEKLQNKQYIINKISFNLDHNGLMTLNVNEFIDDILNDQVNRDVIIDVK